MIVRCRCGQRFKADASLSGQTVSCSTCGVRLTIPAEPARSGVAATAAGKITVRCASCGSAFNAQAHLAGQSVKCPACGAGIQVPVSDPLGALPASPAGPSSVGTGLGAPSSTLLPRSTAYARPRTTGGGFRPQKWMGVVGLLAVWGLLTLIGLAIPPLQKVIFAVGTCICVLAVLVGGVSCLIKVIASDPLAALTTVLLGGLIGSVGGSDMAGSAGRMARDAGLPGINAEQEMGCAGTLLVAGMAGQFLVFINLLLVYLL